MFGEPPQPFRFRILSLLASIGRRNAVAKTLRLNFSGVVAWCLWRGTYLSKLPGIQNNVRVALDWPLDLFFSKDIVPLLTSRSPTVSGSEEAPIPAVKVPPTGAAKSPS